MYDPLFNATYSISNYADVTDSRWYFGEPFWVTVQKFGWKSGTYFWPGSEAEIAGARPNIYVR